MCKVVESTTTFSGRFLIAAASVLILSSPAWAGRPLVTEDAGVLNRGECELESFAGRTREPTVRLQWVQVGCGTGFNTQLAVGAGREKSDEGRATTGALTGKTFVRELTDEQAGFVFAYTLAGAKQHSDSFGHENTELKAVVTVPRGDWLFHGNLGWERSHVERSTHTLFALAVERSGALGPVDLMAEVFGDDSEAAWVQLGARWAVIPERVFIDGSWGIQTNSERSKQVTVGVKFAF
jgi:hypothetical protein